RHPPDPDAGHVGLLRTEPRRGDHSGVRDRPGDGLRVVLQRHDADGAAAGRRTRCTGLPEEHLVPNRPGMRSSPAGRAAGLTSVLRTYAPVCFRAISFRTTGATFVPNSSIARMTLSCGR